MGRSLFGNSTSAVTSVLTRTLGNTSSGTRDNTTTSTQVVVSPGGFWAFVNQDSVQLQYSFARNSVSEQQIYANRVGVLQDSLSDYTYIQGPAYYNNTFGMTGAVYDADLNQVYGWGTGAGATKPYLGELFCIKIYASNLYFFSTDTTNIYVTKVALPSGVATTVSWAGTGLNNTQNAGAVFNWPVNGKFWIFATQGSVGYQSYMLNYDIASHSIVQFGPAFGSSTRYVYQFYGMHVKSDGSAASVAVGSTGSSDIYGVVRFNASEATFTGENGSGHFTLSRTGASHIFCQSQKQLCAVTTDALINYQIFQFNTSTYYYSNLLHLQGGDLSVITTEFQGIANSSIYPVSENSNAPSPSLQTLDQIMLRSYNQYGIYGLSRSGNVLVVGVRRSTAYIREDSFGAVASKLPDPVVVSLHPTNVGTGSNLRLAEVRVYSSTQMVEHTFATELTNQNSYQRSYLFTPTPTTFVTSSGKFFSIAVSTNQSSLAGFVVQGVLPVYVNTAAKTFNAVVIGGGGSSSGTNGTSSQFAGIAAAGGQQRNGFVSGSVVYTSGPSRGTGGTGYSADGWGQGEDASSTGAFGGGSGYVVSGQVVLAANSAIPYKVGFGPQYGKQGAILLTEV